MRATGANPQSGIPLPSADQQPEQNTNPPAQPVGMPVMLQPQPRFKSEQDSLRVESVDVLLIKLDHKDDAQYEQALIALRTAISTNNVPAARLVIDRLKELGTFDDEKIFPLDVQLNEFSDNQVLCLAKAGYEFSADYFPHHCEDKTIEAIQNILFGEDLKQSPLSVESNEPSRSSEDLWFCVYLCGTLDENRKFDEQTTMAELLLRGFRKPVAIWLAKLLGSCSPSSMQGSSLAQELSDAQTHLFGLMLLNEMRSPPAELQTADPLVAQQCRLLASVANDSIQLRFENHERFFKKYLSCTLEDYSVNTYKLRKIFRDRLGLPDCLINCLRLALAQELEHMLNMPISVFSKSDMSIKQVLAELHGNMLRRVLRRLPQVLTEAISTTSFLAEVSETARRAGESGHAHMTYVGTACALLKKMCQQMQILVESGQLENLDLTSSDEASESDSDSDDYEEEASSGAVSKSEPEPEPDNA